MCLVAEKSCMIRCAETEIECWKVLMMNEDGELYSPFMRCHYTVGEEKTIEWYESLILCYVNERVMVTHGLHTYTNYNDAALNASETSPFDTQFVLARCVIPVGAKYVEGTVDSIWAERGYVSDRLKIIEIVP